MPNIARPSVRPSAAKTKIVLVQSAGPAARQVKRIEEPDRTPLRLAIGVTTASLSALGLFAGQRFGAALGKRLDVVGGLVLIGIGAKTLFEHLSRA